MPAELTGLFDTVEGFVNSLSQKPTTDFTLTSSMAPYAKLAIIIARRRIAEEQERLREVAAGTTVHDNIDSLMNPVKEFQDHTWYRETEPIKLPAVSDYLTLQATYDALQPIFGGAPKPVFESKFGILQSQNSFLPRLRYALVEASLRNSETTVAFADIDNFKGFNEELTETVVDRSIIRPVLREIEAHCFARGEAFQFGGDEYVLLLPNFDKTFAKNFLFRLQERLENLSFSVTEKKVKLSIGSCTVDGEAHYTEQEILELANKAKAFAKRQKDCIGIYNGVGHPENQLFNISRHDLVLNDRSY